MNLSQEKLAELADVSIQMIKRIEGRRTWVSEKMLTTLAGVLGVSSFQLLVPSGEDVSSNDFTLFSCLLQNLKQNIHDDIDNRFDQLTSGQRKRDRGD